MVEIFGKFYYIDFDAINDHCNTGNVLKDADENEVMEFNIFKFDIIKMCVERLLNEFNETDNDIPSFAEKETSVSFKFAFNTLLKNKIIIEEGDEDEQ